MPPSLPAGQVLRSEFGPLPSFGARIVGQIFTAIAVALVMTPVLRRTVSLGMNSDFLAHMLIAEEFDETGRVPDLHFLFHVLGSGVHRVTGLGIVASCFGVTLVSCMTTGAILQHWLMRAGAWMRPWANVATACGVVALVLLAAPLQQDGQIVRPGYFYGNLFHNPTFLLVRPLALGALLCVALLPARCEGGGWQTTALGAALLALVSVLAKASFAIAFLPALGFWLLFSEGRRTNIRAWTAAAIIAVPMVAALWVQWSQYHNGGAENSMHFRPFALVSTSFLDAAKRQFVSLLCPLSVLALFRSAAWRDPALRLAWLTWAAGWVLAMGFVEDGPRLKHMNFFWSIQISTFCVFALSAMAAVRLMADATTRRPAILAMGLLALHAGFGVWMWKWYAFGEHAAR